MKFARIVAITAALWSTQAIAQVAGVWVGKDSIDPITDAKSALAFIYDNDLQGSAALRCQNGHADFFVQSKNSYFKEGQRTKITVRIGTSAPQEFDAISPQTTMLAIDAGKDTMIAILKADRFALRYSTAGNTITQVFVPILRTNTLHMVGRVLAACDLAPYPQTEIDAETKALSKPKR